VLEHWAGEVCEYGSSTTGQTVCHGHCGTGGEGLCGQETEPASLGDAPGWCCDRCGCKDYSNRIVCTGTETACTDDTATALRGLVGVSTFVVAVDGGGTAILHCYFCHYMRHIIENGARRNDCAAFV
jgi:hypothetical protein